MFLTHRKPHMKMRWAWALGGLGKVGMYTDITCICIYIYIYRFISLRFMLFDQLWEMWQMWMFDDGDVCRLKSQLLWVLEGKSHQGPQPCKLQKPTKAILKLSGTLCTCGAANYSASCSEVPAAPVASHFGASWACWDVSRYIHLCGLCVLMTD